jgi:hypothetical protein
MVEPQHLLTVARAVTFIAGIALLISTPLASPADRLTDRDVKELIARIEQGHDRFDDALEDKIKHSIVRGPNGEANVDRFLDDFQESIDRLEERLKPDYAGSAEAAAVLRQGSIIQRFFGQQAPGMRGESEWNRLATDLKTLAAAYGTEFPLPSDTAAVRRVGDRELSNAVDQIGKTATQVKKALDGDLKKDLSTDPSARQAILADADQMSKDAKALKSRVNDGKPSSAEADRLFASAKKIQAFIDGHQLPAASAAWAANMPDRLQSVASAYGASWPGAR